MPPNLPIPTKYKINEIFYSLQGEGMRAGTANFFIRFTGCNLKCSEEQGEKSPGGFNCDTEFVSGRDMTIPEIIQYCKDLSSTCKNVIFTGGEPALQLDAEILTAFKHEGFYTAVETNGTIPLEVFYATGLLDWITLSPKVAEHCVKVTFCNEIKYVRGHGQGIPRPSANAQHYLISPAFDGGELDIRALQWCIYLVKSNPAWRLSVQQHKTWKVR